MSIGHDTSSLYTDPPPQEMAIVTLRDRVSVVEHVQKDLMERLEHVERLLATPYSFQPGYSGFPQQLLQPWMFQPQQHFPQSPSLNPGPSSTPVQSTGTPRQPPNTSCQPPNTPHLPPNAPVQSEVAEEQAPTPLPSVASTNALPSSATNKSLLCNPEDVIARYPKLRGESKAGALACKLAQEAFFGNDVLKQCIPSGNRELPALPVKEVADLKKVIFMQFPQYWRSPVEFEPVWKKCLEAIQQACKRARHRS